ncbi:hypothetical protein Tco_0710413 [Tanacetum coccineum]
MTVATRDEKWVPFTERVKISSTNVRLETTVPHKKETFQVVIDLIKNSSCFKAFTISIDVLEIFMQQFWYTIKKVQGTDSYEFILANKKCVVNVDVFRTILDICPRLEGVNFTDVLDDDTTLAFLIKLGYKAPLYKHTNILITGRRRDQDETVDVSEESEPEPKPVKIKTASRRVVKNKVIISENDNIISDDLDVALGLGKSISKTEAKEAEAAKQVHATHARIVIESIPEPTRKIKSGKVTYVPPKNLKGVPDESTVIFATSSEGTGTKPGVPDEEKVISIGKVILEWGSKQVSEYLKEDQLGDEKKDDKDDDADDEGDDYISDNHDAHDGTESDEDEIYKYKIRVRKDEDVEMSNVEVEDSDKDDEEVTNAAKADAEKTSEVKDDAKKTELPPTSSSLYVSSGFGDQFLKLSSDSPLVITIKDTTDVEINSLFDIKIQSEVPHIQSPSILRAPVSMISEPTVLTPVQETSSAAPITNLPPPSVSTTPHLRVAKLEKDMSKLKKIDLSTEALASLKTQVPFVVDNYLGSKVGDLPKKQTPIVDLEQESEKSPSEILKIKKEQAKKQRMSKLTIKSTDKALKEFDHKSALYQTKQANKSFKKNPANHRLYHALMETLIEDENAMDKGVADIVKDHK